MMAWSFSLKQLLLAPLHPDPLRGFYDVGCD